MARPLAFGTAEPRPVYGTTRGMLGAEAGARPSVMPWIADEERSRFLLTDELLPGLNAGDAGLDGPPAPETIDV